MVADLPRRRRDFNAAYPNGTLKRSILKHDLFRKPIRVFQDHALTHVEAMIFRLFRRGPQAGSTIAALYGAIVAQARRPAFYLDYAVPDTPEGRFDLIVLHLALVCRRLSHVEGPDQASGAVLSQQVFDMFCRDMDHNLREMGVGDLSVPKKMQKLGEAFYGRLDVYDRALSSVANEDLAGALARNVLGEGAPAGIAHRFAAYVRAAAQRLDATPIPDVSRGEIGFPDPATIAAPACEAQS
jgi:cytochrome b pre-mRNA-processing protein 3